ncbi:DUF6266 family protein [Sphingobacterium humi]|uniref:Uncharacterized protein n=1 Tax=Sphingobacterium humi TaxID=1796905 RepID=A0A6N8KU95_9SPHI|nr:DUF6266 family protein [Sphingobacterium humi]MVZ61030.1 hypothetical protein [Sphingobacterium humi]
MARISKGILGGLSGKIGNVVGSSWRNIDYVRAKGKYSQKEPSEKQLSIQQRFKMASDFMRPLSPFINIGFNDRKNRHSYAVVDQIGALIKTGFSGNYPAQKLNYPTIQVSRGSLQDLRFLQLTAIMPSVLSFSWEYDEGKYAGHPNDQVFIIAYEANSHEFYMFDTAKRSDKKFEKELPARYESRDLHCWLFCLAHEGSAVSSSQYLLRKGFTKTQPPTAKTAL